MIIIIPCLNVFLRRKERKETITKRRGNTLWSTKRFRFFMNIITMYWLVLLFCFLVQRADIKLCSALLECWTYNFTKGWQLCLAFASMKHTDSIFNSLLKMKVQINLRNKFWSRLQYYLCCTDKYPSIITKQFHSISLIRITSMTEGNINVFKWLWINWSIELSTNDHFHAVSLRKFSYKNNWKSAAVKELLDTQLKRNPLIRSSPPCHTIFARLECYTCLIIYLNFGNIVRHTQRKYLIPERMMVKHKQ